MADYKTSYSSTSRKYIKKDVSVSALEQGRYDRSKIREAKYNTEWCKRKVNINDLIKKFILDRGDNVIEKSQSGVKYNFEGSRYIIKCDKVSGYLRIWDKKVKKYCKIDGTVSNNLEETHFKIKKREEM